MARFGSLDTQYFDDAGDPLVSGKIYFYETGTTTAKTTYADINYTIPNSNPVILTAAGRQPNIFFDGVAKAILTKSDDTQILVRDPVGDTASTFGNAWIASKDYNANDVVQGSDGNFYVSLVNGNVNNNPVTTSGYWTFLYSVEWNAGTTYKLGSVVTYDSIVYQSLQNANLNKNPSTETSWWVPIQLVWNSTSTYAINANVVGTDGILYTSLQNANTNHIPASSPSWWVGTSAAAAASATAAAASASAASTSATNAANSATTATTQATNAASSASSASTSASNASTSATNAASSASSASTSASNASTSATNAANSATAASTSASNAATSETNAAASASSASSSASTATTQASNAASSASSASTSASNASTSATNAANSASSASTSATNASNSASSASTSATNAASSATSAASSAASAATSYDNFDDRYLGQKSSDPTVDNDGNPLITGALYFNTVSNEMKVYNGSSWQAVAPVATTINLATQVTGTLAAGNGGTGITSPGTAGNVLTSNGTAWTSSALPAGGLTYVVKTSNYTTQDKEGVLADTSGGAFTVTLPATPATGAQVVVADSGASWGTNNLTIGRNGSTIGGLAQDLVCDITGASVQLVYDGSTWEVYAQIGGNGGNAATQPGNNAFTGANTFYNATGQTFGTATSTQDGLILAGRAGGSSSYRVTVQPGTLTASRTLTLPDATDTAAVLGTAQTFTATQTFSGSTSAFGVVLNDAAEVATVSATAATGTINYDITTQSVLYYTSNASANWTVNFRASSGTSLNTALSTGQSVTVAFLVTQGSTAYYNSAVQVDGSSVTPKWQGGTAPAAGNASGIDVYVYTIIKVGSASFTVLASQTQFK